MRCFLLKEQLRERIALRALDFERIKCIAHGTANLLTNIMDFRGFDSSIILISRGDIPFRRGLPGKFESTNLSRDNVSREIGRRVLPRGPSESTPPSVYVLLCTMISN